MVAPTRSTRLAAFSALAAFLLGLFAAELHLVLEPHRYCAVHETVEHVGEADEHADDHHAIAEARDDAGASVGTHDPDDEHEACRLASLSDERAVPFDLEPFGVRTAPAAVVAVTRRDTPRAESVPRYRLAPKQSPPAA